jgi:hypothetical protein
LPPSLCPGHFLFCDGFEQGLANWTGSSNVGGQASVDSIHVYRGAKALHSHLDALAVGASATALVTKYGSTPWPTHVFTRLFAYVPSPYPPSGEGLLDIDHLVSPFAGIGLLLLPPSAGLGMLTFNTSPNQNWRSTTTSSALDQWVCFEVEVDTTAETSHLYMNDAEVTDLMHTGLALPQLGLTNVGLSVSGGSAQGPTDAWLDEVAVDSARIGCAN